MLFVMKNYESNIFNSNNTFLFQKNIRHYKRYIPVSSECFKPVKNNKQFAKDIKDYKKKFRSKKIRI